MLNASALPVVVSPTDASCGAIAEHVDLSRPLHHETVALLRDAWLQHRVLAIPGQNLTLDDLERVAALFGTFGRDPFIAAMPGRDHVAEIRREANETSSLFAESWHSDWSFLPQPPAATLLYGVDIPPHGGDTLFADQCAAYDALDAATKQCLQGLMAVHSARRGYAPSGRYGSGDKDRSMTIIADESAYATQLHPVVKIHPETGRPALAVNPGYTESIAGLPPEEGHALLRELFTHQVRPEFLYRHRWQPGMLLLWDNRAVLHAATGGYEGHRRLLWRITLGERAA